MTNATRAMYPESSKSDRKKNSVTMVGRKLSTLPTPLNTPSMTSDCSTSFTCAVASPDATASVSAEMPASSISDNHAPTTLNVSQNKMCIRDRYYMDKNCLIYYRNSPIRVAPEA